MVNGVLLYVVVWPASPGDLEYPTASSSWCQLVALVIDS